MAYDDIRGAEHPPQRTMQLIAAVHLQEQPNGSALVVDDRTLTAAHLNKAACILLDALRRPRTQDELITLLAEAARCDFGDAVTPVARVVEQLTRLGWIEFPGDAAGTGGAARANPPVPPSAS